MVSCDHDVTYVSPVCHLCHLCVTCVICVTCVSSVIGYIVVYNVTIEVSVCHVSTQMISIHY